MPETMRMALRTGLASACGISLRQRAHFPFRRHRSLHRKPPRPSNLRSCRLAGWSTYNLSTSAAAVFMQMDEGMRFSAEEDGLTLRYFRQGEKGAAYAAPLSSPQRRRLVHLTRMTRLLGLLHRLFLFVFHGHLDLLHSFTHAAAVLRIRLIEMAQHLLLHVFDALSQRT